MKKIYLASASPRRQALLKQIGLNFNVIPSKVKEIIKENLCPGELVENLALDKARDVAGILGDGIVIGADTVVVLDNQIMGKPLDSAEAALMLTRLSGAHHQVMTGVAIIDIKSGLQRVFHETTCVRFRNLTSEIIENYINSGEPFDKAGAYAIQGLGSILVDGIEGCYFNVVGLPLTRVATELSEFGINLL